MKCLYCGKEFERQYKCGPIPKCCCRRHYWLWYYIEHKEKKNAYSKKWFKKNYIPHPKPLKYKTPEEREAARKQKCKDYWIKNKEYYRQKNREWYAAHKDNEDLKKRHAIAMKKYYEKKKGKKNDK